MDKMKAHDVAFFFHSCYSDAGVYGLVSITSDPNPDETAREKESQYFNRRVIDGSKPWVCLDVGLVRRYKHPLLLPQLNALSLEHHPKRLSVIKIFDAQFEWSKSELEANNRS
jgi:predicted RNA-binding protein with PUA-like domain